MPTLYEYALIADAVYGSDDDENTSQKKLRRRGWRCPPALGVYDQSVLSAAWAYATGGEVHGSLVSSGFQGRAFVKGTEAVAAYKGTRPTQMSDLIAVADAGAIMPPKSTWFEPKLADGLVSHVLD